MSGASRPDSGQLAPFIFAGGTRAERRQIAALVKSRRVRSIGPRLYTSLRSADVPAAARAAWATILTRLYPDALISHRSALEFTPSPSAEIIVTATTHRVVAYPGLTFRFVRGPGARDDDDRFMTIRASSRPRAFLENLAPMHAGSKDRVLDQATIEHRLEQILHLEGEASLLQLRDRAREIADELAWPRAFERLDQVIGVLLGTRAGTAASALGRARAIGEPFDTACLNRLQLLFGVLRSTPLPTVTDPPHPAEHFTNKAFFEAYFSNFIEGTTFEIDEAEAIVFDGKVPARRPIDAHDILGTSRLVSDPSEARRTPASFDELLALLQHRHRVLMARRLDARPGAWKDRANRAGNTTFVDPTYVRGTLRKGHELYAELAPGLPRAIFMMFLVADVHPFTDGNGRIARIMMNAELHAAGQTTIIIPTAYREEYTDALRALTRRDRPQPLVDALVKAQGFSRHVYAPYPAILAELQRRNWFREAEGASIMLVDAIVRRGR